MFRIENGVKLMERLEGTPEWLDSRDCLGKGSHIVTVVCEVLLRADEAVKPAAEGTGASK